MSEQAGFLICPKCKLTCTLVGHSGPTRHMLVSRLLVLVEINLVTQRGWGKPDDWAPVARAVFNGDEFVDSDLELLARAGTMTEFRQVIEACHAGEALPEILGLNALMDDIERRLSS